MGSAPGRFAEVYCLRPSGDVVRVSLQTIHDATLCTLVTVRILQKCFAREAVAVPTGRRVQHAELPRSFRASVCSPPLYALRNQLPSSISTQSYTTHSEAATSVISFAGIQAILLSLCMCSLKCKGCALVLVAPHRTACDVY